MCDDDRIFPAFAAGLPAAATPVDVAVASVPTLATLVLWSIYECTSKRSSAPFTPNMVVLGRLLALAATAFQGWLVYRIFLVFDCESAFANAKNWAALPLVLLASVNVITIFALAHRYPRWCAAATLLLAAVCVGGEYAGRDLLPTAGVQHLIPIQQLYCVILVTLLTNPREWTRPHSSSSTKSAFPATSSAATSSSSRRRTLRTIDPLQQRPPDGRRGGPEAPGKFLWWA